MSRKIFVVLVIFGFAAARLGCFGNGTAVIFNNNDEEEKEDLSFFKKSTIFYTSANYWNGDSYVSILKRIRPFKFIVDGKEII